MIPGMPDNWRDELRLFLGIMLTTALAGMLTGLLLPGLLLGLFLYLLWHLYQLTRLPHLLRQDRHDGQRAAGLWKTIVAGVNDLQDGHRERIRELYSELERFRDTVNSLPDAVVILDPAGRINWSSTAAARLLGVDRIEAHGRFLAELIRDPVLLEHLEGADFSRPLVIRSPVDRTKVLSVFITPLQHEKGQLMLVAKEITRQYYLDTAQRDFVANVSHELRTPLTVISGLANYLPRHRGSLRALPDRCKDLLSRIRRGYYHPEFYGSFSLKSVLPVLVPSLSYDKLSIQEGGMAGIEYLRMVDPETPPDEKEKIRRDLLEYCGRDTLAMAKIREELLKRCRA